MVYCIFFLNSLVIFSKTLTCKLLLRNVTGCSYLIELSPNPSLLSKAQKFMLTGLFKSSIKNYHLAGQRRSPYICLGPKFKAIRMPWYCSWLTWRYPMCPRDHQNITTSSSALLWGITQMVQTTTDTLVTPPPRVTWKVSSKCPSFISTSPSNTWQTKNSCVQTAFLCLATLWVMCCLASSTENSYTRSHHLSLQLTVKKSLTYYNCCKQSKNKLI